MNAKLYEAIKNLAKKINDADKEMGQYAIRKINYVNANSDLKSLVRVAEDLEMMAKKVLK